MRDSHMHTPFCKHAGDHLPQAYARSALEREVPLDGIAFTCHSPVFDAPNGPWTPNVRMTRDEYPAYLESVTKAKKEFSGELDILLGLELDYIPETSCIEFCREILSEQPLDIVLGSVHPMLGQYKMLYGTFNESGELDFDAIQEVYFEQMAMAAEATRADGTAMFDVLSHPDLVKILNPKKWNPASILESVIAPALDRIANTGVALELNTSGLLKPCHEIHPSIPILEAISVRNIPVVINSDAHTPARVGQAFDEAFQMLRDTGISEVKIPVGGREFETLKV